MNYAIIPAIGRQTYAGLKIGEEVNLNRFLTEGGQGCRIIWDKMKFNLEEIISDFVQVSSLAGVPIPANKIIPQFLSAPHSPPKELTPGKMAIYIFFLGDQCLKVGKAGPKSQARYTTQHYNPKSSQSNLAKSILKEKERMGLANLDESNVGQWIKNRMDRINFLIDEERGIPLLSLLESFLQCRLKPKYEGFESQK